MPLILPMINWCAVFQDLASKIFNIVNIIIMFSKSSNREDENNYKTNATMIQTSPEAEAEQLCLMTDGQTNKTRLGSGAR